MVPIADLLNDLGEPDAVVPPVRFDEEGCPITPYSTQSGLEISALREFIVLVIVILLLISRSFDR